MAAAAAVAAATGAPATGASAAVALAAVALAAVALAVVAPPPPPPQQPGMPADDGCDEFSLGVGAESVAPHGVPSLPSAAGAAAAPGVRPTAAAAASKSQPLRALTASEAVALRETIDGANAAALLNEQGPFVKGAGHWISLTTAHPAITQATTLASVFK